ncbi:hypothetical protein AB0M80_26230 [Amycolatopsis sp. NPDC051045]|uniref:hypothetical protein n=1 Tax=Amycolatopsis sp. NPDC051045 TaxID=3156922 RepID=UPI0034154B8A
MFENYALFSTFLHLRPGGLAEPAGRSCLVPPGRRHRLTVDEPGDLLSITSRTGTEHERAVA